MSMIIGEQQALAAYRDVLERTGDELLAHESAEAAFSVANPELTDEFLLAIQVAVILARHILSGDLPDVPTQRRVSLTSLPR